MDEDYIEPGYKKGRPFFVTFGFNSNQVIYIRCVFFDWMTGE
jgi:hypothetical protein